MNGQSTSANGPEGTQQRQMGDIDAANKESLHSNLFLGGEPGKAMNYNS